MNQKIKTIMQSHIALCLGRADYDLKVFSLMMVMDFGDKWDVSDNRINSCFYIYIYIFINDKHIYNKI